MRGGDLMKKLSILIALLLLCVGVAKAEDCTVTVNSPALIQAAIDSNPSGVVCLSGTFNQSVVFGPAHNGYCLPRGMGEKPSPLGEGFSMPSAEPKLLLI